MASQVQRWTAVCCNPKQRKINERGDYDPPVLHIQGASFDRPGHTLCGWRYTLAWRYDLHPYPVTEFAGCEKCLQAYRRWSEGRASWIKVGRLIGQQKEVG